MPGLHTPFTILVEPKANWFAALLPCSKGPFCSLQEVAAPSSHVDDAMWGKVTEAVSNAEMQKKSLGCPLADPLSSPLTFDPLGYVHLIVRFIFTGGRRQAGVQISFPKTR